MGDLQDIDKCWETTTQDVELTQQEEAVMPRSMNADLEVSSNNGTVSIRPTAGGRLKSLVQSGSQSYKVWTFGECREYEDSRGNQRVDHIRRGVLCGSLDDLQEFEAMCKRLGLVISRTMFYVPFSNSKRAYAQNAARDGGRQFWDYHEEELSACRVDLPTESQLRNLL